MLDESHRGHLKFWFSEFDDVAVAAVEAVGVVEEGREGEGVGGGRTPAAALLMEIFLSPVAIKPEETPNSSWIILDIFIFLDLQQSKNTESKRVSLFV